MAIGLIVSVLFTPVMIRLLGKSEYGLYNTVASTISMLSLLSMGFNSSYIRFYSKYKANDDKKSIYNLNGLFILIFGALGIIALVCGIYLSYNLNIIFGTGLTENEYAIAKILTLLLTINLATSFPISVFTSIITAHERYLFLKTISIFKTVGGPLVTLPILLSGYRSIAMVAVTLTISCFADVIYMVYAFRNLKIKIQFGKNEKGLFKTIFIFTSFIAINMIVDQINWNIGQILLGRFKGTEAVAIYSVGYTLYTYYQTFSTSISGVFTPRIHKIVNTYAKVDQERELLNLMIKIGRIQFLLLFLICSGFVFFGNHFIIEYWAGHDYSDSYYIALLLMIPASIALIQNLGIEIQRAMNKHKFRSICYLLMAIINLMLSIVLCKKFGSIGCAIGTALSLVVANGLIMNIYYHKYCNLNMLKFWKHIISILPGTILPIICGILLRKFIFFNSLITYIASIFLYSAIYVASMWMFGMNGYEKNLILSPLKKLFCKNKRNHNDRN